MRIVAAQQDSRTSDCLLNERSDFLPLNQWLSSAKAVLYTGLLARSVHN
jgi:hypothetical protein